MASQRLKYACTSCTRRKVKCSKTVPCSNCVRRGEQDTCSSEATTPGHQLAQQANSLSSPPLSVADRRDIQSLRSRVHELETELQRNQGSPNLARQSARSPHQTNNDSRFSSSANNAEELRSPDAVTKDAASILEFLAWGRRMNPDYNSHMSPEASANNAPASGDVCDAQHTSTFPEAGDDLTAIAHLQLLLPSRKQILDLVRYHEECLLWYHCSYYPTTFRSQLDVFYNRFYGSIESRGVNMQWLALLFAIMTGSITCAPSSQAQEWGFRSRERETLSRRWCRAVYTCLNAAEYTANQSILSVQAISTLTISVHLLGFSNMHSIHLATGIRIAQSLGLHRITDEASGSIVEKECGRRLWSQLCCQDWFSIPFSDTYLINPLYSKSLQPINCHDHEMIPLPDHVPTVMTYCRILTRVASIMPQLQDDIESCNTPYTKYEQIIKWDKQMRSLSTSERPMCLSNIPIDPEWPQYIPWARRSLAITSAHKIIMIHRSFLSESFTNPAFSFTRRTCLAASKTIIKEVKVAMDENEPNFWISQAFSVAASIILILDMLHRTPAENEYREHKQLAEDALTFLQQCKNSMIATRGVKLLSALLETISGSEENGNARKRRHDGSQAYDASSTNSSQRRRDFSVAAFVKSFCSGKTQSGTNTTSATMNADETEMGSELILKEPDASPMMGDFRSFMGGSFDAISGQDPSYDASFFPPGLESATPFENLLYLANHDFNFMGT